MLRVLLGFLITVEYVFGAPQRGTLQETFQALQNLQQQQGSSGSSGTNSPSDQNFSSGSRRPSGSSNSDFDAFNGPGFGGGSGGSNNQQRPTSGNNQQRPTSSNNQQRPTSGNNQQRPTSGNNQQGFDAFNGPAAQGSGSNSGRPSGNQQGWGGSQSGTTVRSPLNVVSNENTIPEASCVQRCMAVSTYDPVCGTDDITYTNRAKFRCAQNCGRRVNEAYRGACVTTPSPN